MAPFTHISADTEDKQYKALMFDFDGTLFDTKKLNFKAYQLAYFDLGVTITEEMFDKTDGLSVYEFNQAMGVDCDVEKLRELKKNYYADMVKYATPNNYLIKLIKKTNCKTALVTSARLVNIDYLLKAYELKFDVMITQEDVAKHKPEPDSYNLAIERLGLSPEECLAFEDSRPGFVAARKAGADCVMVGKFEDDCIRNMSGGSDATTKLIITEPKSESSKRTIPIPDCLLPLLRRFKDNGEVYVVSGRKKPVEPRTMQYRFAKILHNADLPSFHYHSLRHLFATRCVELGFDVKTLSEILGHSSVEVTLNRYIHSDMERKRTCMSLLSKCA